jgi:chromatin remodeling complex protein RSC6
MVLRLNSILGVPFCDAINGLELVNEAHLESCTVKSIVNALESRLNTTEVSVDLIKELIDTALMERVLSEEDAKVARQLQEEELGKSRTRSTRLRSAPKTSPRKQAPRPRKVGITGFNKPMILSDALSELLDGTKMLSRPAVVKKIWEYVKSNELQDPSNRKIIQCDPKMEAVFKRKRLDCFQMNRFLGGHLRNSEEIVDDEVSDLPPAPKKPSIAHDCPIPSRLRAMVPELQSPAQYRQIQEGCLEYVKASSLFDPENPTSIDVDDVIRTCLGLQTETKLSLFDFVDRVKSIIEDAPRL